MMQHLTTSHGLLVPRDLGRPLTAEERNFMELPGNVYWEFGNVNSNEDSGNVNWESRDWEVNSSLGSNSNSSPGLLPTPDKVGLFQHPFSVKSACYVSDQCRLLIICHFFELHLK